MQAADAVWSYTRRKCLQWKEAHYQLTLTGLLSRGTVKRCESLEPCLMKHFGLTNIHKLPWSICYLRLIWKGVFWFTVHVKIDGFLRIVVNEISLFLKCIGTHASCICTNKYVSSVQGSFRKWWGFVKRQKSALLCESYTLRGPLSPYQSRGISPQYLILCLFYFF